MYGNSRKKQQKQKQKQKKTNMSVLPILQHIIKFQLVFRYLDFQINVATVKLVHYDKCINFKKTWSI